jgi:NADH-quinone oxidoreductase subunit C
LEVEKMVQDIITDIESETGNDCQKIDSILNEQVLQISGEDLRQVVEMLKQKHEFHHLSAITAQILENDSDYVELLYHFWKGFGFTLLLRLKKENPVIDSIIDHIPGSDFYEREVAEMYGVKFNFRDGIPPLLLPDDWVDGPPMLTEKKA